MPRSTPSPAKGGAQAAAKRMREDGSGGSISGATSGGGIIAPFLLFLGRGEPPEVGHVPKRRCRSGALARKLHPRGEAGATFLQSPKHIWKWGTSDEKVASGAWAGKWKWGACRQKVASGACAGFGSLKWGACLANLGSGGHDLGSLRRLPLRNYTQCG